jgi:hypothetical protein
MSYDQRTSAQKPEAFDGPTAASVPSFLERRNFINNLSLTEMGMNAENKSKGALAKQADASFRKEERFKDAKQGAADYEAAGRVVAAKTARLKALRLAKEATDKLEEAANAGKAARQKHADR